jgi:hypothetical protein
MQVGLFQKLRASISSHRLDSYRQAGQTDFEVIVCYLWNVALCEALYPALQSLEITLRNSIHGAAVKRYGNDFWFDLPACNLHQHQRESVDYAKAELLKKNKPLEASRIVAELTFGFWTSLLNSYYEQKLWPWLLLPAFPCMPRRIRTRHTISSRLNRIRELRNRVFHHERISNYSDLPQRHATIGEALGWVSAECGQLLKSHDRFQEVYESGVPCIREKLGRDYYADDYAI